MIHFNWLSPHLVYLLIIFSQHSNAADTFKIEICDTLIALDYNHPGKMLCWWETESKIIGKYTYAGKLLSEGKFIKLPDGIYSSRNSRGVTIKVEDTNVLFHENRVYLKFKNENYPKRNYFADFYRTNFEGIYHKVYIGYFDSSQKKSVLAVAKDGEYESRNGVKFTAKDGFLPTGCTYEIEYSGHFLLCEDLN